MTTSLDQQKRDQQERRKATWRRFTSHPSLMIGTVILVLLVAVALAAPWLAPYSLIADRIIMMIVLHVRTHLAIALALAWFIIRSAFLAY